MERGSIFSNGEKTTNVAPEGKRNILHTTPPTDKQLFPQKIYKTNFSQENLLNCCHFSQPFMFGPL